MPKKSGKNKIKKHEDMLQTRKRLLQEFKVKWAGHADDSETRILNTKLVEKLRQLLPNYLPGFRRLEYTGSGYMGLQIGPDIEYDIVFIFDGNGLKIEKSPSSDEYFMLKSTKADAKYAKYLSKNNYLKPSSFKSAFCSSLQKAVNDIKSDATDHDLQDITISLIEHGPAIQMNVYKSGRLYYCVDTVPCLQTDTAGGESKQFVAKQKKSKTTTLWRLSLSMDEKASLQNIGRGNNCQKQIIRLMKAMQRHGNAAIQRLTSYHIYTAILHLTDEKDLDWSDEFLYERLMDVLEYLQICFQDRKLLHFFLPSVNLFADWKQALYDTNKNRIKNIRQKPSAFAKIMRR